MSWPDPKRSLDRNDPVLSRDESPNGNSPATLLLTPMHAGGLCRAINSGPFLYIRTRPTPEQSDNAACCSTKTRAGTSV